MKRVLQMLRNRSARTLAGASNRLSHTEDPPVNPIVPGSRPHVALGDISRTDDSSLQRSSSSYSAYPIGLIEAATVRNNQWWSSVGEEGSSGVDDAVGEGSCTEIIEESNGEEEGLTDAIQKCVGSTAPRVITSARVTAHGGIGRLFKKFGTKLQQLLQVRLFSTKKKESRPSTGPRILKLCLSPHPLKPGKLTIHNLCIHDEHDCQYIAKDKSREKYNEKNVDFDPDLLERLNEHWASYEKRTNSAFRKMMWNKHGIHSGLTVAEYFGLALHLFDKVNEAFELSDFSGQRLTANMLSVEIHKRMEAAFGMPGAQAFPEICAVGNAQDKEKSLGELRLLFKSDKPYLPHNCKRQFARCAHDTIIKL